MHGGPPSSFNESGYGPIDNNNIMLVAVQAHVITTQYKIDEIHACRADFSSLVYQDKY